MAKTDTSIINTVNVKDIVTRVEFNEYKDGNANFCRATQEGIHSEIKALKNLFIGAVGLSTAIITVWQYILHAGVI